MEHLFSFPLVATCVDRLDFASHFVSDHVLSYCSQGERTEIARDGVLVWFQEAECVADGFLFARRLPTLDVVLLCVTDKCQHQFVHGQIGRYPIANLPWQTTFA